MTNENPDALRALCRNDWLLHRAAKLRNMKPEELSALLLEQAETGLDQKGQTVLDYPYCCPCYQASGCTSSTTAPWTMVWSWSPTPVSA